MKFKIAYSSNIINNNLLYLEDEHSFYMNYGNAKIDLELLINNIALQVSNNRIIALSGFCGLKDKMSSVLTVPTSSKGILSVNHNLKYGFAYSINENDEYKYPVSADLEKGWVCIGNSEKKGNAVEFIDNCIAVISDEDDFISLWLKPMRVPKL